MLVLDMDDTLLTDDHTISEENKVMLAKAKDLGVYVVLASGRPTPAMTAYAKELQLDDSYMISYNGAVITDLSNDEVRCAYSNCALLAFPSSYEGFGIPILEAMVARKPMVLSELKIFREITQNQSVYFDVGNVESIADAIEFGLCSQQVRDNMIEYGVHRVHDFEFGNLAKRLSKLYRTHLLR